MSERAIIKLEKGQVGVQFETIEKLCTALDVPPCALFEKSDSAPENMKITQIKQAVENLSEEKLDTIYNLICGLKKL